MLCGAALMLSAMFLILKNQKESNDAKVLSDEVLRSMQIEIAENIEDVERHEIYNYDMPITEIDGHEYVGYLILPTLNRQLPVMAEWSYSKLKVAPCRYSGTVAENNLVIAAHNYSAHFGKIGNLKIDDEVIFCALDGGVAKYRVADIEYLQPNAVEEMTAGEYDLTLFTCDYSGQKRMTVRCSKENR